MSFRIGQRCRVIRPPGYRNELTGREVTVVSAPFMSPYGESAVRVKGAKPVGRWVHVACLIPIDEDDSRKVIAWKECVWQPARVTFFALAGDAYMRDWK